MNDLETKGYINDSDFAKMYATHLVEKKMIGKIAVRDEFYKHQIPDSILDPILDDLYESHPPLEIIQYIISKRMKTRKKTEKEKTRLINLLKRKGFTWDEMESEIKGMDWGD